MTRQELFNELVRTNAIYEKYNLLAMFNIHVEDNKFMKEDDGRLSVFTDKWNIIDDTKLDESLFKLDFIFELDSEHVKCLDKPIRTTIGVALLNLILIEKGLNAKATFINKALTVGSLEEDIVVPRLLKTDDPISVEDLYSFDTAVKFLEGLNSTLVQPTSLKALLPPPDLAKKKAAIIKEIIDEKGKDAFDDPINVAVLEDKLFAIDKEWLKDDPTLGIGTDGKIMNTTRKKLFLMIGQDTAMPGTTPGVVFRTLVDGYGLDVKDVTAIFNGIIAGNYSKGVETQVGGTYAKLLIRASMGMEVVEDDCGTEEGLVITVTKSNFSSYEGRYIIGNEGVKELTKEVFAGNEGDYIIRSKSKCASPGLGFCKVCTGTKSAEYTEGTTHNLLQLAGDIVNNRMKLFHSNIMSIQYFPILDHIH